MFLPQWLLLVEGAGETGVTLTADLENWKYYHDLLLLLIYILVKLDHPLPLPPERRGLFELYISPAEGWSSTWAAVVEEEQTL